MNRTSRALCYSCWRPCLTSTEGNFFLQFSHFEISQEGNLSFFYNFWDFHILKFHRNIAHLDIKPQNIVLMSEFPNCEIKLCDLEVDREKVLFFISRSNFQIFGKFSDFWKIFWFMKNFQIFGKLSDFLKIFRFSEDFYHI